MEITVREGRLPVIKTKRLLLRDIKVEDITDEYVNWLNDPEVNRFLEIRFQRHTRETVTRFIKQKLEDVRSSKHFGVYDSMERLETIFVPWS